jgi:hypothetical protein
LPGLSLPNSVYERITGSPEPSTRFGLLVVTLIVVAIAVIVLVVLIIGRRWMHANTQRQPAPHPVHPPDRGRRTLIPVEKSPSSIVNPLRRQSLSSAAEDESSCTPVWEHSSRQRICFRLPLRPLRARPRFARLKPTPRGRSSCPTVATVSGGLFIGATRHGADGFGFGGAHRTNEFEPAPVKVRGLEGYSATRSAVRAYLMQNSGAKGRFGASSPIRCVVSHRLQSADNGRSREMRGA